MTYIAEYNQVKQPVEHSQVRLQDHVQAHLDKYFSELGTSAPSNVYNLVLHQVEKPMIEVVLQQMRYNQSKTASVLGISRGTLRKKMKFYGLLRDTF